ncbi:unnamed protein product [Rotaria magnacalcarata]
MLNTFADTFGTEDDNTNKMSCLNPFDLPSSTTDPFGISDAMKLSESSEKFDDNPFIIDTHKKKAIRPRSGKEALSSSNWLAYQHSMDEANFDGLENMQDKSVTTQSNNTNPINPFLNAIQPNQTDSQVSPIDFLFDINVDQNTILSTDTDNSSRNPFQIPLSNDLNRSNETSTEIEQGHDLTEVLLLSQQTKSSNSTEAYAKTTHVALPSLIPAQTNTSVTSNSTFDNQFLDWLTTSNNSISDVHQKNNDINTTKNSQDFLEDIYLKALPTSQKEASQENFPLSNIISQQPIRHPSNEQIPSISIHESIIEQNNRKILPKVHANDKKTNQSEDDSDEDTKMIFRIAEKKQNLSNNTNIAVPLLPPPPSSKNYNKTNADASSSSSSSSLEEGAADHRDDDDPFAIFQTKSKTNKINQQQENNLFIDWNQDETKLNEQVHESKEKVQSLPLDYYLHEPDYDDSAPLESYHNDINDLQLQQLNGWLLLVRVPLRQKDLYKSTFQRFSEARTWQECYVRIFSNEKKIRFYLPQTIEQPFAEISLETWYQCTKLSLQQYDQYSKVHTFKLFEANYHEIPQVRIDRLVTLPEKLLRKFTRPNKAQQVLLDHTNCVQQEIIKFGQLNYTYLKQFSIILDDLFWSMPITRNRFQKHLKEEITIKILDEYYAKIDIYHHICKHKSRTRLFILAFLNDTQPIVEIGINDWFRRGKEVNKRNEIIINKTLQEYWIQPEQVELASIIDSNEYENSHLLKLIPPDSHTIEIMRFRTRPKQNIELPLQVYCFMSVIDRQVNMRIEVTVSNAFNMSIISKASSMITNDKTANIRDDNSDEQCPCEDIQIRFPIPDAWVYMFRVEKRFRYGAIHSVRRKAGKIKGLDRFMVHRNDGLIPLMTASAGVAKYEQAFHSIVWRIDQLPKRDHGAYKTHLFECKISVPSHDPVPEKYEPIADVEYSMSQAFVSHCQIRSVAVPTAEETPEKWIRPKSRFTYKVDIEYAFKEEEKKDFAPIEIDMKEQPMSQNIEIKMAVNSTRSLRKHVQRSLGNDFVEPPSIMSTMVNDEVDDDADDDGTEDFQPRAASSKGRPRGGGARQSRTGRKTNSIINQVDDESMETSSITTTSNTTYADQQAEEKGYFHHLLTGKTNIQVLVDQWIDSYQANRDEALIELMQFFLDSSGCKGKLTQVMYLKMEHVDMLRSMTEHFDEDTSEYPIVMSGLQYKKFRLSFSEFVVLLIKQSSYSVIYDQYMIDNLVTLLTALSDSPVRAFRHTGTLAVLKVMTALVDIALTISIQRDQCQRQYEAERQKTSAKRAADRLDTLTTKRKELEGNENEIKSFMNFIFKGVFIHRYRDVVPDIRCLCMSELGEWMKSYPMVFLDDIYLKYIGWTLYDKVGDCRLRCLLALIPLFQTTDFVGKLELFTNRFKDRIVQMTVDCEYEVAVQAVKLLTAILKFSERILEDKDCENIYELVYHSHRQISQAAGEFLNQKLFHKAEQPSNSSKRRSQNTAFMYLLVQFFIESELHEHATYLVDSMWDQHLMMKDWECMTDILLEAPDQEEDQLDDQHENALIEIMVCCVRQAATGEYPIGRGQPNRKLTMKEQKQKEDDKKVLTDHFISTLPRLLNKYVADADKLLNLLQIPLYFNYEVYTTTRRERDLDFYLNALSDIVQRHTTAEIFDAVSKCFECICDVSFTLSNRAIAYRGNIIDNILANFNAAMGIFEEMDEADEDDLYPLLLNLRKLDAFHQCYDLGNVDLWDKIHLLFKATVDNEDMSPEIADKCFGIANRSILWGLHQLGILFDKVCITNFSFSNSNEVSFRIATNVDQNWNTFFGR